MSMITERAGAAKWLGRGRKSAPAARDGSPASSPSPSSRKLSAKVPSPMPEAASNWRRESVGK